MLNPQNETNDITDTLNGSLTTWYANVDSALKASECMPGYYEYTQAPSYGTQCPINEGGSTRIDIATNRFNIVSLDNSYIDVEFEVPITIPQLNQANTGENNDGVRTEQYCYYIGFKSAFDLIDSYRIYSNGDLVYTQNHANFESFINYISLTDQAKENSACFATVSKVQAMKPNVPGTYIQFAAEQQAYVFNANIKLKIPINAFLMLSNLKWFPSFMGRLSIEIFPSYKNLVWCKVDNNNDKLFSKTPVSNSTLIQGAGGQNNPLAYNHVYKLGVGFHQINQAGYNGYTYDNQNNHQWLMYLQTFSCNTSVLKKFHLYLATYMLKMEVYNALEYNYLQVPLLFPIQTVTNVKFTSALGNSSHFTLQNTATLSHCDTVFVVFPEDVHARTCFTNPEISSQFNINGKYYPREAYSTINDPRFFNMELDALNINNNPLISISEDVNSSINPYSIYINHDCANNRTYQVYNSQMTRDKSNFFIGVPLSTDEDFMGGISSNGSTVQIELIGDRAGISPDINQENWTQPPEAIFLEDKLLKIYSMKPQGKKQIDITNATLEQIAAGA